MQSRETLKEQIAAFDRTYTLVRRGEVQQYTDYAAAIASFDPEKACAILRQKWRTEEGKTTVVKILKMMPTDARDEIFAALTSEEAREFLDRFATAVVEKAGK